ncbi:unnamed protein product [Hydatigera taeniaeformis]|uniref:Uncharacterized protein n=1 Tax=Hydatigena taeniaeformis TaxID=6205 RepID=A0A0R3X6C3_HYDTA|nr:unnamed protein product [Hydatigera taeniaeformis]
MFGVSSPPAPTTEIPVLRGQAPREQLSQVPQPSSGTMNTSQQTRKWPSFSMRRSGRLSSTSSALVGVATTPTSTHGPRSSASGGGAKSSKPTTLTGGGGIDGFGGSLLRSFSAERHRVVSPTPACTVDPATPTDASASSPHKPFVVRSASSPHRKESDDGSRRVPGLAAETPATPTPSLKCLFYLTLQSTGYDAHRNSVGFQKTKKVFTNLFFGKHSKKCRSPATTPTSGGLGALQHPILPPMAPSVLSPSVSPQSRIDSLPPPHPTVSTTTLTNATDTL